MAVPKYITLRKFSADGSVQLARELNFKVEPYKGSIAFGHLSEYPADIKRLISSYLSWFPGEDLVEKTELDRIAKRIINAEIERYASIAGKELVLPELLLKVKEIGWDIVAVTGDLTGIISSETARKKDIFMRLSCNKKLANHFGKQSTEVPYWIGDARLVE